MKKLFTLTLAAIAIVGMISFVAPAPARAQGPGIWSEFAVPYPGLWKFGSGIGQATHIRISGAPTDTNQVYTVVLSRVSPVWATDTNGWKNMTIVTNASLTFTCVNGGYEGDIGPGTNFWLTAGDWVQRSGTVTNATPCLLFLRGQN